MRGSCCFRRKSAPGQNLLVVRPSRAGLVVLAVQSDIDLGVSVEADLGNKVDVERGTPVVGPCRQFISESFS